MTVNFNSAETKEIIGAALPSVARTITQGQLNSYADVSGDRNPIHLDAIFAASTQFGGIIAHGMLTLAFISEMMTAAFGLDWLTSGSLKVRFKGATYVGTEVETWGKVTKEVASATHRLITCTVGLRARQNEQEIISGTASVKVTGNTGGDALTRG